MDVTAIVIAAFSSSTLTAVLTGVVNHWTARAAARRQQRIEMLARWRKNLEAYADGSRDQITAMPWYAEIHSVLSRNGIDLRGVEDRTMVVPPSQYHGDPSKRVLQTKIAELARKWGLD